MSSLTVFIVIAFWFDYVFIKQYIIQNVENRPEKKLFYPSLMLFICCTLSLILMFISLIFDTRLQLPIILISIFYGLQMYFLTMVLFFRLRVVFNTTKFKLSKFTVNLYLSILISYSIGVPLFPLLIIYLSQLFDIILIMIFITNVIINVSLSILFIYKMNQVSKQYNNNKNDDDEKLLNIIKKNAILTVIANISTIFVICGLIATEITTGDPSRYYICARVLNFLYQVDVFTNLVCIALCFQYFEPYYILLCKCTINEQLEIYIGRNDPNASTKTGATTTNEMSNNSVL